MYQGSGSDEVHGTVRQQGLLGGILLGLSTAVFLRSHSSGMALVNQLKMAPK